MKRNVVSGISGLLLVLIFAIQAWADALPWKSMSEVPSDKIVAMGAGECEGLAESVLALQITGPEGLRYDWFQAAGRAVVARYGSGEYPEYVWFGILAEDGSITAHHHGPFDLTKHGASPCLWFMGKEI